MNEFETSNKLINSATSELLSVLDGIPEENTDPRIEHAIQELYGITSKVKSITNSIINKTYGSE